MGQRKPTRSEQGAAAKPSWFYVKQQQSFRILLTPLTYNPCRPRSAGRVGLCPSGVPHQYNIVGVPDNPQEQRSKPV